MIKQLNPPIPVVTPKGKALAHMVIDYGPEADLIWVCFQDDSGECWCWSNKTIRIQGNVTLNRPEPSIPEGQPIKPVDPIRFVEVDVREVWRGTPFVESRPLNWADLKAASKKASD